MTRLSLFLLLGAALLVVSGCEDTKRALGKTKRAPDEFAVYSRAPLSLPPEYTLRVPAPGEGRPDLENPRDEARKALTGSAQPAQAMPKGVSVGEQALLRATGATTADPGIRALVNRETSILAEEDKTLADKIIFWQDPAEYGKVVDPAKESQRIQENQALGKPITEGETPTIERKRKALLEGVFN